MKSLISIIILSLILTNCGFKPIYNSKNSNFEITDIKNAVDPNEILFVVDSMTGQDAVNTAKSFNDRLDFVLHFASPASPIDYLNLPIQTLKAIHRGFFPTLLQRRSHETLSNRPG